MCSNLYAKFAFYAKFAYFHKPEVPNVCSKICGGRWGCKIVQAPKPHQSLCWQKRRKRRRVASKSAGSSEASVPPAPGRAVWKPQTWAARPILRARGGSTADRLREGEDGAEPGRPAAASGVIAHARGNGARLACSTSARR